MARRKAPHLPDDLLDQLLAGGDARAALDPGGLLDDLKKALAPLGIDVTVLLSVWQSGDGSAR